MTDRHHTFDVFRAAIAADLKDRIKVRDRVAVGALRAALHVLDNATAAGPQAPHPTSAGAEVARRVVDRAEMEDRLLGAARERAAAAVEYRRLGRDDHAEVLQTEASILRGCLSHLDAVEAPR